MTVMSGYVEGILGSIHTYASVSTYERLGRPLGRYGPKGVFGGLRASDSCLSCSTSEVEEAMPRREFDDVPPVNEEEPYSVVILTMEIRVLHDEVTRSRLVVEIYPDPSLEAVAKRELDERRYGTNHEGEFVVNLSDLPLDLNHGHPLFDTRVANPAYAQDIEHMNRQIGSSVNWVLDLHKRAMAPRFPNGPL